MTITLWLRQCLTCVLVLPRAVDYKGVQGSITSWYYIGLWRLSGFKVFIQEA